LDHLKDHVLNIYGALKRQWIFLFPEGGFLHKRLEGSQRYARQNNLPVLEHVTLPRVGAFHTLVKTLHPSSLKAFKDVRQGNASNVEPLKWIIDITIGYPKGKPIDLLQLLFMLGKPCSVFVHYRRFPIRDVPTESEALTHWLYDRFVEKEKLLDEFYQTGSFPKHPSPHSQILETPKAIDCKTWHIVVYNIGLIVSTWIHYKWLSWVVSILWPF